MQYIHHRYSIFLSNGEVYFTPTDHIIIINYTVLCSIGLPNFQLNKCFNNMIELSKMVGIGVLTYEM